MNLVDLIIVFFQGFFVGYLYNDRIKLRDIGGTSESSKTYQ